MAAQTFLQLCQRARLEFGMSGTGPVSVSGNTNNEYARLVNWIRKADLEIQAHRDDWRFMWKRLQFDTVVNQGDYTEAQVMAGQSAGVLPQKYSGEEGAFRYYLKSIGVANEQFMAYREFNWFDAYWRFGTNRLAQGQPFDFTQAPDRGFLVAQIPNAIYTIVGQFYRRPVKLVADGDVPLYDEQYHELPIWWAMVNYAGYEESGAKYTDAKNNMDEILGDMIRNETPDFRFTGTMA